MIIALCCLLSALLLYVNALKNALGAKRWGLAGLLLGPVVVPMYVSHKRMQALKEIKTMGNDAVLWQPR